MNFRIFLIFLAVILAAQTAQAFPFAKTFTLSEFSAAPGVKVKVETISDSHDIDLPAYDYSVAHPVKKVTVLLFPNATFFSPKFFTTLPGFTERNDGFFPSGFEAHLVVAGPDKTIFSTTSVTYTVTSDGDAAEFHINFAFYIAADLMQNSCLLLHESFPRSGGQWFAVYLGARP